MRDPVVISVSKRESKMKKVEKTISPNTKRAVDVDKIEQILLSTGSSYSWHFVRRGTTETIRKGGAVVDKNNTKRYLIPFEHSALDLVRKNGNMAQKTLGGFVLYINYLMERKEYRLGKEMPRYTMEDFLDCERDRALLRNQKNKKTTARTKEDEEMFVSGQADFFSDFVEFANLMNLRGETKLRKCLEEIFSEEKYQSEIELQDQCMLFRDEGDGIYQVFLRLPYDLIQELGLKEQDSLQVEVQVCEDREEEPEDWEGEMRDHITSAVSDVVYYWPLEEELLEKWQEWFAEKIAIWDLEEEEELSEDKNPFSEKNMATTLKAYRLLYFKMELNGEIDLYNRACNDPEFGQKMFRKYEIPDSPYDL